MAELPEVAARVERRSRSFEAKYGHYEGSRILGWIWLFHAYFYLV